MKNSVTTSSPWQNLPELPLLSILHSLLSFADISAFSAVCRSWRSFVISSSSLLSLSARPPLLLHPSPSQFTLHQLNSTCHHLTPLDTPFCAKYRSNCLGFSRGYAILSPDQLSSPFLVDVVTGRRTMLPELPKGPFPYYHAALTASPGDDDCRVLVFSNDAVFCCCLGDPGEPKWRSQSFCYSGEFVRRVICFKGMILVMNSHARLFRMELDPVIKVKELHVKGLQSMPEFIKGHFGPQLVECEGKLMLVLFPKDDGVAIGNNTSVKVYGLNWEKMEWSEFDGLGDYCVFIDCKGKSPFACSNPSAWGGRGNCLCLTGPKCEGWWEYSMEKKTWSKMSLQGEKLSTSSFAPSFLTAKNSSYWPSPIWVYPSHFYVSEKVRVWN